MEFPDLLIRLVNQKAHFGLTPETTKVLERHLNGITSFYATIRGEDADIVVFFEPGTRVFAASRPDLFQAIPEDCWAKKALSSPGGEGILGGFILVYIQDAGLTLINVTAPVMTSPGGNA